MSRTKTKRRKRPQNPKFDKDSLTGLSWTRVTAGDFPHNRTTLCCNGKARPDDIVITVPLMKDEACIGTSVIHAYCLRILINEVPEDIRVVKARVNQIRRLFLEAE